MKKKTLSFFLFGAVTLILGVVSVSLYLVDWNQYRDTLANLVSERLGMQVELAGDLNLGFLPRPTVSAQAVRLSPRQNEFNDTIATADRIDMHLGLAALMQGSMEIQSLAFEGLSAGLIETTDGWAIEGWPQPLDTGAEGTDNTLLSLDRFRVKSGSISVRPLNSKEVVFDGVDVALTGQLPGGPLDVEGSAFVEGSAITLSGKVVPTRTAGSTSVRVNIAVAASKLEFSGRLSDTGKTTGRFQASGQNLAVLASFMQQVMGAEKDVGQIPTLPFGIDLQLDRSSRGISRLISRQLTIGDTRGAVDLTVAEQNNTYHVTGTGSLGVIALDGWKDKVVASNSEDINVEQSYLPVAGNFDIAIEGIEYKGGLAQQIEASISLMGGQILLQQLRATLPGASRLAYIAETNNVGAIKFQSGGVQEIFEWLGLHLSETIPAGRLSTADIEGRLAISTDVWVLSEVSGTIDTSAIAAELSGSTGSFVPNAIKLNIDQLNLDAYWPTTQFSKFSDGGPATAIQFDLDIAQLRWLQRTFDQVAVAGRVGDGLLSLSNFSAGHQGGSLTGSFSKQETSGQPSDIETSLTFNDWSPTALAKLAPEAASFMSRFSDGEPVSGTITATGPLPELQSRLSVATGAGALEFAGTVDATENRRARLQGSVRHANISRVLELEKSIRWAGISDGDAVNLQATIDGAAEIFSFSANGMIAGGQSNFSGTYDKGRVDADISLTIQADIASDFDTLASNYGVDLDPSQLRRLRLKWTADADDWQIADLDMRNGDAALAGELSTTTGVLSGDLSASNIDLSRFLSATGTSESPTLPLKGSVAIKAANIGWLGQTINSPAASIVFSDAGSVFNVGQSAMLNGGALQAKIELNSQKGEVLATIAASSLDVGALAKQLVGSSGFTGTVSTNLNLSASTIEGDEVLATLSGDGSFDGGVGSLHFMAVNELISTIADSASSFDFLQSVGGLLRGGDTNFTNLTGSFRLDNGVALVDEIVASGGWGSLSLDGQANIPSDFINMSGQLSLSRPIDAPTIPVVYEGRLSAPDVRWTSRALEKFALAGVERRLRSRIFGELEQARVDRSDSVQQNPGAAVFGMANSLLAKLRARQVEKKRIEAEKRAQELDPTGEHSSPGIEGQMP